MERLGTWCFACGLRFEVNANYDAPAVIDTGLIKVAKLIINKSRLGQGPSGLCCSENVHHVPEQMTLYHCVGLLKKKVHIFLLSVLSGWSPHLSYYPHECECMQLCLLKMKLICVLQLLQEAGLSSISNFILMRAYGKHLIFPWIFPPVNHLTLNQLRENVPRVKA